MEGHRKFGNGAKCMVLYVCGDFVEGLRKNELNLHRKLTATSLSAKS